MNIETSVLDYLGKIGNGVLALISFTYKDKYYEGMFYYTDEQIMLNVDDELESELGCGIKEYSEYEDILRFLIRNVVPWSEMINRIDEVDLSVFQPITTETVLLAEDLDSSQIISGTAS